MSFTRISFFHFPNRDSRWWAFKQMQIAHQNLSKVDGLKFYKLLGSGAGEGFSIKPDWSVYALLQVWESEDAAKSFERSNLWYKELEEQRDYWWHFQLIPYHSKGTWKGEQPFEINGDSIAENYEWMAVITRARIKWTHLIPFWLAVPSVSRVIKDQKSLLYQKGIGEWPLIEQATFSLWNQEEAMREFAYKQKAHREVVRKTRKLNWYSEEQFSRFAVADHHGFWPNSKFENLQKKK